MDTLRIIADNEIERDIASRVCALVQDMRARGTHCPDVAIRPDEDDADDEDDDEDYDPPVMDVQLRLNVSFPRNKFFGVTFNTFEMDAGRRYVYCDEVSIQASLDDRDVIARAVAAAIVAFSAETPSASQ